MTPRAGWRSITPRIVVDDVDALVAFLRATFDAEVTAADNGPAIVDIGDSKIMVSVVGPRPITLAFLHVYVDSADAVYAKALARGAKSVEPPLDLPWGDRRAMFEDPAGNVWQVAHVIEP